MDGGAENFLTDDERKDYGLEERLNALEDHVALLTTNMQIMQAAIIRLVQDMQEQAKAPVIVDRFGGKLN